MVYLLGEFAINVHLAQLRDEGDIERYDFAGLNSLAEAFPQATWSKEKRNGEGE
ncbi:MAG: hypothetical protein KAT75_01325 [Dehalococcoidia bacterium]|nr:hypothetical protein [Dehalococcoidia bacterium]